MLQEKLDSTRRDLLDLSARNRLINTRRTSSRSSRLEIVDERADEVFRILVRQKHKMSFLPRASKEEVGEGDNFDVEDDLFEGFEGWNFSQPEEEEEVRKENQWAFE